MISRSPFIHLLERCWILASAHSAWVTDGADSTAGIAVSSTVCHTLSASIRINILGLRRSTRRLGWHWWYWDVLYVCRRHTGSFTRLAGLITTRHDCNGIWTIFTSECLQFWEWSAVVEIWKLWRWCIRSFALFTQYLLLAHRGLVLLASFDAKIAGLLTTKEIPK